MTTVHIRLASLRNGSKGPAARRPGKRGPTHALHGLICAAALAVAGSAAAQQSLPMRVICVPSEPLLADVQSGGAVMREVFVDGEGDQWFVFERVADGASMIGWINVERAVFCIVAGRAQRQTDGNPGRGV